MIPKGSLLKQNHLRVMNVVSSLESFDSDFYQNLEFVSSLQNSLQLS